MLFLGIQQKLQIEMKQKQQQKKIVYCSKLSRYSNIIGNFPQ